MNIVIQVDVLILKIYIKYHFLRRSCPITTKELKYTLVVISPLQNFKLSNKNKFNHLLKCEYKNGSEVSQILMIDCHYSRQSIK